MPRAMTVSCVAASISRMLSERSFDANRIDGRDRRWDYGEDRYQLLGTIEGRVFVLIYTMRGSAMRIISARKANKKEVREYEHGARQD